MTKASYKLTEYDGRYYFNDGTGYVLVDTGFHCHSRSLDGKIGPFSVSNQSPVPIVTLQFFLSNFLGPAKPEGQSPKAILYPLDMKTCLLKGDTITIDDSVDELPAHRCFLPFVDPSFPVFNGKCNGKPMKFYFDTGMRMAVVDDPVLAREKECLGTIKEWIPPRQRYVDTPYYPAVFEFADGFQFEGHAEYDAGSQYLSEAKNASISNFDVFFGNEIFKQYDLFISSIPGKKGLALISKDGKGNKKSHAFDKKPDVVPSKSQAIVSQEKLLKRICQETNEGRREAIEFELLSRGIGFRVLKEGTLVIPAKSHDRQNTVVVCAHYDVYPRSKGFNDNGMSIIIILGMLDALPDNVEVVFTNGEESGMTGATEYLKDVKKTLKACINLDVCGCFDEVYLDPMNCEQAKNLTGCKKGTMPASDAIIFSINNIPAVCFSTGKADVEFQAGIELIFQTMHMNSQDNDFSLLNFEMIPKVQEKVLELVGLINA